MPIKKKPFYGYKATKKKRIKKVYYKSTPIITSRGKTMRKRRKR